MTAFQHLPAKFPAFHGTQENAGDLALAAVLAGRPAASVLLAALEQLEKVNPTGMVALQYLRFEDELEGLPLLTLRKLRKLRKLQELQVEQTPSARLKKNGTPERSVLE